ncbi:hypothetical protein DL89DRAFT_268840 [Linderina pennispora]|uniref:Recombination protein Rad52 n=1 Tax=Linderina pennispora TaxID=61395 RepID=A0A1Y1W4R5_9FUNG|nr:uncharacterized protein DL89DRAFT_268840 [Linderina pennispora]ORX68335.1 hypothetical protein DL89DRAFT_268840 [Linderina pennispora]
MAQYNAPSSVADENRMCGQYTPEEFNRIQISLSKKLGPEHISTRRGAGNVRLSYIEGWRVISIANEVFGFNGWNSKMLNMTVDFMDINPENGHFSVGVSCTMRISLKDGTYKEDIGYGMIENVKSKAMAFEKVKKEAVTDGLKRAMRQFGNVLGNCVYDKDYLRNVTQIAKQARGKPLGDALFRYSDLEGGLAKDALGVNPRGTPSSHSNESTPASSGTGLAYPTPQATAQQVCDTERRSKAQPLIFATVAAANNDIDDIDFDMDDILSGMDDFVGELESNRPIIPESPSFAVADKSPVPSQPQRQIRAPAQYRPQQMHTPARRASSGSHGNTPQSSPATTNMTNSGDGARNNGTGASFSRIAAPNANQSSAARNLNFPPAHPGAGPQAAAGIPQQRSSSYTSSTTSQQKSFLDINGFSPARQVRSDNGQGAQQMQASPDSGAQGPTKRRHIDE